MEYLVSDILRLPKDNLQWNEVVRSGKIGYEATSGDYVGRLESVTPSSETSYRNRKWVVWYMGYGLIASGYCNGSDMAESIIDMILTVGP